MTYSKKFFTIFTVCASLIIATGCYFLCKWASPLVSSLWVFTGLIAIAIAGRISGTLAERFTRLFGKAMFVSPFRMMVDLFLRRNIQTAEMVKTPQGFEEINYVRFNYNQVLEDLEHKGENLEALRVNLDDFRNYLEIARYDQHHPDYYKGAPKYLVHKQIQHYLSTVLTPIDGSEVWMDVASSISPFPEILTRLYGIDVYRQDLSYPPGVRGLFIGSNAAAIPLSDDSIDRISLHCSFEHFEKDSDSGFLRELARLLKPGGTACIIPLYLSNTYQILTNPHYWLKRSVPREAGAQITISRIYWESHGRFYNAEALEKRVIRPLHTAKLNYRFIKIEVPPEVDYPPFVVLEIEKR